MARNSSFETFPNRVGGIFLILVGLMLGCVHAQARTGGRSEKAVERKEAGKKQKSSLAIVEAEKKTPDGKKEKQKPKLVRKEKVYFARYTNPFLEDLAQFERDIHEISDAWEPGQEAFYPYEMMKINGTDMANRILRAVRYLQEHPQLPSKVSGFTDVDVQNIARLARFAKDFARAARIQHQRKLLKSWAGMQLVLKELRKNSWWPQPMKILMTEDAKAPALLPGEEE